MESFFHVILCDLINREARKTSALSYAKLQEVDDEEFEESLSIFALQCRHTAPQIKYVNLVVVSRKNFFDFIAYLASIYLAILQLNKQESAV